MSAIEKVKKMSMDEFYHLCNRLAREMGFRVRNGVYREDTVVIDAYMPVPGGDMRYIIIFLRRDRLTAEDVREMVDFETLQIRWMLITTGKIEDSARAVVPENMDVTLMDGSEFERLISEFGLLREERERGSYLPSVGQVDNLIGWAEEFYRNGNYEKALNYVEQAERIKRTPKVMKLKARILTSMGGYDEALGILKELLVENVRDDEAWFLMGLALQQIGADEDAEEAYGQCVRFNPRNVGCWLNRGNILFAMEKYDEALLCYENALKVRQDIPNAWNNRGVVLKHKGKYDEAMRSYNAAIKYDSGFAQAYLNKAILFYEMRRYEEAENALYEYLKIEESEEAYLLLADIYRKRGMQGKAEEMARKALQVNPASVEARKILGEAEGAGESEAREIMKGIDSVIEMLGEDMDGIREILEEARRLAERGELEGAREKLQDAKKAMREHVAGRASREALISEIRDLCRVQGVDVPEGIEDMSISELERLRDGLLEESRGRQADEVRERLVASLDGIERHIEEAGMLDEEVRGTLQRARELIQQGDYQAAMETLVSISAGFERRKAEELRRVLVEDTAEMLEEADIPVPDNIDEMDIAELRELRRRALKSLRSGAEKEAGGESEGGLRDMVRILGGAAMSEAMDAAESVSEGEEEDKKASGLRDELVGDIMELAEIAGMQVPEGVEDMSISELKELRRSMIERIKSPEPRDDEYPGAVAHLLYEMGSEVPEIDDAYGNNAMGLLAMRDKNYGEAARRFRRALAINPEFREAEFNLAYALHLMGRYDEARMHLRNLGMNENFFSER